MFFHPTIGRPPFKEKTLNPTVKMSFFLIFPLKDVYFGGMNFRGECSSVGRAPDCGSGGRGFDPHHSPHTSPTVSAIAPKERRLDPGLQARQATYGTALLRTCAS